VGLAILAVVTTAVSVIAIQMINVNASTSNRVLAIRQVQEVGYTVSRDALQAQYISTEDDEDTTEVVELLTIEWVEWYGVTNTIIYTKDGDQVVRTVTRDGSPDIETIRFISEFDLDYDVLEDVLTLTVTATVGGFRQVSETRIYEIIPRARL